MAGLCTFVMKSGARIEFRADDLKFNTRNGELLDYEATGICGVRPMYVRVGDIDAILWLPDSENDK